MTTIGNAGVDQRLTQAPHDARPTRLRRTATLRGLVRETSLDVSALIQPLFVVPGRGIARETDGLPGIRHLSADEAFQSEVSRLVSRGIRSVLLFGLASSKDPIASESFADDGAVQRAVRLLRQHFDDLLIITDVCCCAYTSHGHCGLLSGGTIEPESTVELLARIAVSHAEAGADLVAPSAMADGMVRGIRGALDEAGYHDRGILSYAVKYASAFYGPFRDAANSAPAFGDRGRYQMDPANRREALREAALDEAEGADLLMIKPALAYLDVIAEVRAKTTLPIVAYNVSGEYAMIKAAAASGWLDERAAVLESLTSIRRAGADAIVSYHANDVAGWLQPGHGR
ncbi:MAG: porphobilinogen synthase [Gemmatimonadota bacterium]